MNRVYTLENDDSYEDYSYEVYHIESLIIFFVAGCPYCPIRNCLSYFDLAM